MNCELCGEYIGFEIGYFPYPSKETGFFPMGSICFHCYEKKFHPVQYRFRMFLLSKNKKYNNIGIIVNKHKEEPPSASEPQ